ncbi:MAG: 3'(2'),5'-bisphosphate nucleotidase CysQ [Oligoflexales bacterium]|nr:3'(2'),5'-bisphosphate nucleotidase CysQ [Oligoflexales bacterium]
MNLQQRLESSIQDLNDLAVEAGLRTMDFYNGVLKLEVKKKSDQSPVTSGDIAAHEIIERRLLQLFPEIPVVSEESYDPSELGLWERTGAYTGEFFWLIDPIDGTREYIQKTGDFTINISLIQGTKPLLGIIYAPLSSELFYGLIGAGSYKQTSGGPIQALHTQSMREDFVRLVSRRPKESIINEFQKKWPKGSLKAISSSIKLCRLAEGVGDFYIRNGRTQEWDTAAGQCILEAAGGKVCTLEGEVLPYRKEALANPSFIAVADPSVDLYSYIG